MSSEDARANGELDPRHLDLLRRYRDAMRNLLSLSRAEYAPRIDATTNEREDEDEDEDERHATKNATGPPLTPSSVLYASLVVAPTRRVFSWAVPTSEALAAVERHAGGHLLEMGAGTGFWTALLRARGNIRRIDAFDIAPCDGEDTNGHHATISREKKAFRNPPPFAAVRRGTPETFMRALETGTNKIASRRREDAAALLLCWPPREEPPGGSGTPPEVSSMASRTLERFEGDAVLYVGEPPPDENNEKPRGDGTRDETKEKKAVGRRGATAGPAFHDALLAEWACVERVPLPRWPGAADALTVWRRKSPRGREKTRANRRRDAPGPRDSRDSDAKASDETVAYLDDACESAAAPRTETTEPVAMTPSPKAAAELETRRALLREAREAWESATVAGLAARASRGGARAMRGAEQTALRAVRRRSGVFRRLALAFL